MEENNSTERRSKVSRRSILKQSAGAVGLAAFGTADSVSHARARSASTVDIPKYVQRDTVVEYSQVPTDWYSHLRQARKVNRRVQNRFADVDGVIGIGLGRDDATYGGKNGLQVRIQLYEEQVDVRIPSQMEGIPVQKVQAPNSWGPAFCTNVTDDMTVYGAEAYRCEDTGGAGSTACRVFRNGEREMLTCAHTFWKDGNCNDVSSSDLIGRVAEQYDGDGDPSDNREYGDVVYADKTADFVTFDDSLDSDTWFDWEIDNNDGGIPVQGYVHRDTLSSWASSEDHIVYNMGATSGRTNGAVAAIDWAMTGNCTDLDGDGVYTYCDFGQGDSGGPTYDVNNGYAYMVSCTSYRYYDHTSCDGNNIGADSAGVSADHIAEGGISFV